jgi:hypothetical protein
MNEQSGGLLMETADFVFAVQSRMTLYNCRTALFNLI